MVIFLNNNEKSRSSLCTYAGRRLFTEDVWMYMEGREWTKRHRPGKQLRTAKEKHREQETRQTGYLMIRDRKWGQNFELKTLSTLLKWSRDAKKSSFSLVTPACDRYMMWLCKRSLISLSSQEAEQTAAISPVNVLWRFWQRGQSAGSAWKLWKESFLVFSLASHCSLAVPGLLFIFLQWTHENTGELPFLSPDTSKRIHVKFNTAARGSGLVAPQRRRRWQVAPGELDTHQFFFAEVKHLKAPGER